MEKFSEHTAYSKALAVALFVLGAAGVGTVFVVLRWGSPSPAIAWRLVALFLVGSSGMASGVLVWKRYDWAYKLAVLFLVVQLAEVRTANYEIDLSSGFRLFFMFETPSVYVAINYLALALLILVFLAWRFTEVEKQEVDAGS